MSKPNQVYLRDPVAPHDPITQSWTVGRPFQVYGERVSQDSALVMNVFREDGSHVKTFLLNVVDAQGNDVPDRGFGELVNPREGEGPWTIDEAGNMSFDVWDLPSAKHTGHKDAKLVSHFEVSFG